MYDPRKGAKTYCIRILHIANEYHPRKGAKTVSNLVHLLVIRYHPHKGAKTTSRPVFGLDFPYHPRKGAKTGADFFIRFSISTIPVRGRKQIAPGLVYVCGCTIPVRGRKQCSANRNRTYVRYNPRKGTETSLPCHQSLCTRLQLLPAKPSQALRASSPEGRAFPAATYLILSSPFRGSWHGVSRD